MLPPLICMLSALRHGICRRGKEGFGIGASPARLTDRSNVLSSSTDAVTWFIHLSRQFAELLGVSPWELADSLHAHGWKVTNLPG